MDSKKSGVAIALAWPETNCKQADSWYDPLMRILGINKNGYYKAGHAAIILADKNGSCQYFDFGRYHTPKGYGRVRNEYTDPDLKIHTILTYHASSMNRIININKLLIELASNSSCHGEGEIIASYCSIDLYRARKKAFSLQEKGFIKYGPFVRPGTNCSRFVHSVLLASHPGFSTFFRLCIPFSISPSPVSNVFSLNHIIRFKSKVNFSGHFNDSIVPNKGIAYLSGTGAGSWFIFKRSDDGITIVRVSDKGKIEFSETFKPDSSFDPQRPFKMLYPSHYQEIRVYQDNQVKKFFGNNRAYLLIKLVLSVICLLTI